MACMALYIFCNPKYHSVQVTGMILLQPMAAIELGNEGTSFIIQLPTNNDKVNYQNG